MATRPGVKRDTSHFTTRAQKSHFPVSQRIAIIGAGAVGSHFASRLFEAGHFVTFYVQGNFYKVIQPPSVAIIGGKSSLKAPIDWVIVTLKSSSLHSIPDLIFHMLTPNTRVLLLMNGLMIEDDLIRMLKERACETDMDAPLQCCSAIYGGLAFLCLDPQNKTVGKTLHFYQGMLAAGLASSRSGNPEEDQAAFAELWVGTTVEAVFDRSLLRGRWTKMVGNLSTNGISVAMGGITVDQIISDPDLRRWAEQIMDEAINVANEDLERKYGSGGFVPLGEAEKARVWSVCRSMGRYKTPTTIDLLERRPMEVKYLFSAPVARARELGVPVPHLETLVAEIGALQRMYNLF